MGFSVEQFVSKVDENLICGICFEVLEDPWQCKDGHIFCKYCIARCLKNRQICPMGNNALQLNGLARCLAVKNIVESLEVYCHPPDNDWQLVTAKVEGSGLKCEWTGKLQSLFKHRKTCPFQQVQCPNKGCNTYMQRRELFSHDKICDHKLVACNEQCGVTLTRRDLLNHKKNVCPEVKLLCPKGCGITPKRKNFNKHRKNCPCQQVQCPHRGCNTVVQKRELKDHDKICKQKKVQCQNCRKGLLQGELQVHKDHHCPEELIPCPNNCRNQETEQINKVKRIDIEGHLIYICAKTKVYCPFKDQGCSVQVERQDVDEHIQDNMAVHMMLLAKQCSSLTKQNSSLTEECSALAEECSKLDEQNTTFAEKCSALDEQNKSLAASHLRFTKTCSALAEKCSTLDEQNTTLAEKCSALDEQNKSLAASHLRFTKTCSALAEKCSALDEQNKSLAASHLQFTKTCSALAEECSTLDEQNTKLAEKCSALDGQNKSLAASHLQFTKTCSTAVIITLILLVGLFSLACITAFGDQRGCTQKDDECSRTYTWHIKNFNEYRPKASATTMFSWISPWMPSWMSSWISYNPEIIKLRSPTFWLCGYSWFLLLYPNGVDEKNRGFLSVYLYKDRDSYGFGNSVPAYAKPPIWETPNSNISVTCRLTVISQITGKSKVSSEKTVTCSKIDSSECCIIKWPSFMEADDALAYSPAIYANVTIHCTVQVE